jgi:hypothetical protein
MVIIEATYSQLLARSQDITYVPLLLMQVHINRTFWKLIWQFPTKLNMWLLCDSETPVVGVHTKETCTCALCVVCRELSL